jgi:hypothetical protein
MLALINPVEQAEAFDHPDWLFEAKFDGFPAAADTVRGRVISCNSNRMQRLEELLDPAAEGHAFDGELDSSRPRPRCTGPARGTEGIRRFDLTDVPIRFHLNDCEPVRNARAQLAADAARHVSGTIRTS